MSNETVSDGKGNNICQSNILCVDKPNNTDKLLCKQNDLQPIQKELQQNDKSSDRKETTDVKVQPNADGTNSAYMNKVIEDMNTHTYCKTNILNECKFANKMDEYIFNGLPLTNSQKEELLLEVFKIQTSII
jgi:hypothetical protein